MPILFPLLFAVAVFSPEPLTAQPPYISDLQRINAAWDGSNPEGWDKVVALTAASEKVFIPVPEGNIIYRGMGNGTSEVEAWRGLVASQFPAEQVENALCVIRSESGGSASAKNPNSNARGLFQIMTSVWGDYFGWTYEDFYVPELNVYAAARIWEGSGWVPWSPRTRRNCGL